MPETKLFAVTGKPIFHSRSPQLFNTLFQKMGIDAVYTRLAAESPEEAKKTAKAIKLQGFNVTVPFKEGMMNCLEKINKHALKINAVNCVAKRENNLIGYNTDFTGVIRALKENGFNPKNKTAVVLGAGGAARAAVYGLIRSGAKKVIMMNRTYEKAKRISYRLGCDCVSFKKAAEPLNQTELVVSCIPSYPSIIDPILLRKDLVVLDANYKDSPFMHAAGYKKFRFINGLEWLYYQALPAFRLYTGRNIPKDLEKNILKNFLTQKDPVKHHIALIGFMGTGKTTVGKFLAEQTGAEFFDMDKEIEKSSGKTIPEIFKNGGEKTFREIEQSMIMRQMLSSKKKIFSLGGGAVLKKENCDILSQNCHVIWLWSSVQTVIKRMDPSSRPLLDLIDLEGSAERILTKRIPLYAKVSDLIISTETGSSKETTERITNEMDQAFKS